MILVRVEGVHVTSLADSPVLILREAQGARTLAIWISAAGGNAILSAGEPRDLERPSTHDLMVAALETAGTAIERADIVGVEEGVFTARLLIDGHPAPARASDAVALALRVGADIFVAEELLSSVVGPAAAPTDEAIPDDQVERFREFLDTIRPEDFGPDTGQP